MDFPSRFLKPWPQRGLIFILGAIGALAFAPLFIFPAFLLTMSGMWYILDKEIMRKTSFSKIFALGWWWGLGHFTVGLYWITYALTVEVQTFWWLMPFSLFGIPAIIAIFSGFSFMITKFWPYPGISAAFAFAGIWIGVEWLRGHLLSGFPWNLLGYSLAFSLEMTQVASLTGVYGLSFLIILMAIMLQYLVSKYSFERIIALCVYLLAILCWIWGRERLTHVDPIDFPSVAVRIVQPNIPQALKWDPKQKEANLHTLLKMTAEPSTLPLKAIIWPETAVSYFLEQNDFYRTLIAKTIPKGTLLFTGALRRTSPEEKPVKIWNSLLVINSQAQIVASYDKSHLVPFGEYLPFRSLLDAIFGEGTLKKLTAGSIDCTPGKGPESISLPEGYPTFSGLVCYEVIFPHAVINPTQKRPNWMINVTNDGWYGKSAGPYQHLEMARFRAVEEGIPLVRDSNSGISVVFDAYGRSIGSIGLGKEGILDILLPAPARYVPLYARWGDWIVLMLMAGALGLAWFFSLKRHSNE